MKHLYDELYNQDKTIKTLTREVSYKEIDCLCISKEESPIWNQDSLYLARLVTSIIKNRLTK